MKEPRQEQSKKNKLKLIAVISAVLAWIFAVSNQSDLHVGSAPVLPMLLLFVTFGISAKLYMDKS